jgi:hypothetical protein
MSLFVGSTNSVVKETSESIMVEERTMAFRFGLGLGRAQEQDGVKIPHRDPHQRLDPTLDITR